MRGIVVWKCLSAAMGESAQMETQTPQAPEVGERIPVVQTFGIKGNLIISNEYSRGGMNSRRGRLC